MIKRSILAVMTAACMTAVMFAGCGNAGSGASSDAASSEAAEAAVQNSGGSGEAVSVAAENEAEGTHKVIDHAGREVEVPNKIERVVVGSFYPMPSVIAAYLGSAEKIIGIHPFSMAAAKNGLLGELYPEILNASTEFIQGDEVNVEEVLKLKPDVVIGVGEEEADALTKAGIPAVVVSASSWKWDLLDTYVNWIDLLDQVFGEYEIGKKVQEYSKQTLDDITSVVSEIKDEDRVRVLFLFRYNENVMVASGRNFFGQKWCDMVGAVNVAEKEDGAAIQISMEQVYEWNPDVIIITNFTGAQPEDLYSNAIGGDNWSTVAAVQNKRVYKMPLGFYRSYTPGTDTPVTLQWLAKTVYPELFKDVDLNKVTKDYLKDFFGIELSDKQIEAMYNPVREAGGGL